jgi:aspartyl-tRNA synthetase
MALELVEVSDLVKDSGFKVFSGAVKAGGMVKVLPIPGGNDVISNVRIKPGGDLFKIATDAGAKGLAYIRVRADGAIDTIGAIKDNLSENAQADPAGAHLEPRGNTCCCLGLAQPTL